MLSGPRLLGGCSDTVNTELPEKAPYQMNFCEEKAPAGND